MLSPAPIRNLQCYILHVEETARFVLVFPFSFCRVPLRQVLQQIKTHCRAINSVKGISLSLLIHAQDLIDEIRSNAFTLFCRYFCRDCTEKAPLILSSHTLRENVTVENGFSGLTNYFS